MSYIVSCRLTLALAAKSNNLEIFLTLTGFWLISCYCCNVVDLSSHIPSCYESLNIFLIVL